MPCVRDLPAVRILALGEDRHDLVPPLVLAQVDRLDHAARHRVHGKKYSVSAMSRDSGWVTTPIEQRGVVGGLHLDLEAEVLARLARDVDDRGVGAADLEQGHVLDVLRPDGRKALDRARPGRDARGRRGALQDGPAVQLSGLRRDLGGAVACSLAWSAMFASAGARRIARPVASRRHSIGVNLADEPRPRKWGCKAPREARCQASSGAAARRR